MKKGLKFRLYYKEIILIILICILIIGGIFSLWLISLDIPSFDSFHQRVVAESTKIYDRTGKIVLFDIHENIKRRLIPFEEISPFLKSATLAIEDDKFYEHSGVRPLAMFRAIFGNILQNKRPAGGSTITQQAIKNTLLTRDRTPTRKIKELVLALKLEQTMTKEQILTIYLNETPYGGTIYGVEEASQTFFGKTAMDVSLAEAAYIVALARAPTFYSPYGENRDRLEERKNVVLQRMLDLGYITAEEEQAAREEEVEFMDPQNGIIKAPHFVMFVRDYLIKKYGEEILTTRGYRVITTLDWDLQETAEEIIKQHAEENKQKFQAGNAALVAMDPNTGQILTMVGSVDYFDKENGGNFNVTTAHRQPGSAFKPIVYATALSKNFTPETVIFDLPTQFDTSCGRSGGKCYWPSNYDGNFNGPMTLRNALGRSINIVAIKVLYLAGLKDSIEMAKRLGINSLEDWRRYGLTLVLGGGEVSLLELTGAYGVFAAEGVRNPPTALMRIEDSNGVVLEEFKPRPERILSENVARQISDILSDDKARQPTFQPGSLLNVPGYQVATKTGTTNDYKDAWILGYTPNLVVGAWVGNNDNTPMVRRVASLIAAPIWNNYMQKVLGTRPKEYFQEPEPTPSNLAPYLRGFWQGGKSYFIDTVSGKLATEHTPEDLREEKVITQVHSILYWLGQQNDPQFSLWEGPIRTWAKSQRIIEETEDVIPTETDDIHRPENKPNFTVDQPTPDSIYTTNEEVNILISNYRGRFPLGQIDIFLDETYLGTIKSQPYTFSFKLDSDNESRLNSELKIVVYDSVRNKSEKVIPLKIEN